MNEHTNGNNGNGASANGGGAVKQKVFELAQPKSPDEVVAENLERKIAPQIKRAVFCMRLAMAVKGFYSAILDFSFLHMYGGTGRGRIFTNVNKLARILKHDKDSIAVWRDVLVKEKLLWVRHGWPTQEWRITAICPAPITDYNAPDEDFVAGKAGALEESGNLPLSSFLAPRSNSPRDSEDFPSGKGKPSAQVAETFRTGSGNLPLCEGSPSPLLRGNLPKGEGKPSATRGESLGRGEGKPSALCAEDFRTTKETPMEKGSLGGIGGGATPPKIPKFDRLDSGMWPKDRLKAGPQLIDMLKEKIHALENSRVPVKGSKEIGAAYRARIKEIKNWMAQEVTT